MKFKSSDLRAAYEFLRRVAFHDDPRLIGGGSITFVAKPLAAHGYYDIRNGRHCIWVDTTDTTSVTKMLQIMAHEMIHLALGHAHTPEKYVHQTDFKEAANAVAHEMGWPKGSI